MKVVSIGLWCVSVMMPPCKLGETQEGFRQLVRKNIREKTKPNIPLFPINDLSNKSLANGALLYSLSPAK
jgi:hypothetical protein